MKAMAQPVSRGLGRAFLDRISKNTCQPVLHEALPETKIEAVRAAVLVAISADVSDGEDNCKDTVDSASISDDGTSWQRRDRSIDAGKVSELQSWCYAEGGCLRRSA